MSRAKQRSTRSQLDEAKRLAVKPIYPFRTVSEELFRNALVVENLAQGFEEDLYNKFDAIFEVGERVAIIGENGVGKTTLLNTLAGALEAREGEYKWSENSNIGYYAQDHVHDFEKRHEPV